MILSVLKSPRFVSFYWRAGAMFITGFLAFLADNISLFHLSPNATVIIGLILGEITKAINNLSKGKFAGFVKQ